MKKKILTILTIFFIVIGIIFLLTKCSKKEVKEGSRQYDGIYKLDNSLLYVAASSNDELVYKYIENEMIEFGTIDYKDGNVVYRDDENKTISFNLDNNNLNVENTTSNNVKSGIYEKKDKYNIDNFYDDNYGDSKYIDSDYNGLFKMGEEKVFIYQSDENTVRMYAELSDGIQSLEFKKDGDRYIHSIDNGYKEIILDDLQLKLDKIVYKTYEEKTFIKSKTLTKSDICNRFDPK